MAQDKDTTEKQDVDLDDIEVVILILAKSPKALGSSASFLSRRGWPTTVMNNLSQAVEFAAENKPDFVLVSVNHPNPAISKFSDLLTSTFGAACVAFAEGMDTTSNAKLNKSKIAHKIQGQPSGPNLHRSIRKLLAEKLNIQLDDRGQVDSGSQTVNGEGSLTVKGGQAGDAQTIVQKNDPGATHNKAPTLVRGEGARADTRLHQDTEIVSTGKYTMTTKNRRTLKDLEQKNPLEKPGDVHMGQPSELASQMKKSLFGENPSEGSGYDGDKEPAEVKSPSAGTIAGGPAKPFKIAQPGRQDDLIGVGPQSMIERAVQTALQRICRPSLTEPKTIRRIEQVGVFPVDSPALPGYLVLAWPNDEMRAKEAFFKQAQQILQSVFIEMGIQARLEPGFFVTLPQVEFASWADEKSAFSFTTTHGEEEIGVAYFSTKKPLPKPRQNDDKSMYSIGLENISTEQPVNFKVYLHMKKNKKYFLYLRNGRQLQPEQKTRLKNNNVKDLYMKSIDVENLRMFLAACYLRENIKKSDDEAA